MPLLFVRNDITKMETDAIVLPANPALEPGDGASAAIMRAGIEKLILAELNVKGYEDIEIGQAAITHAKNLPSRYIVHAVCPQWLGGDKGEKGYLYDAYMNSMKVAAAEKCRSIAFPLLSTGSYKYPRREALKTAVNAILDFLTDHDMDVYMVFYGRDGFKDGSHFFSDIKEFIDDDYVISEEDKSNRRERFRREELRGRFDNPDWYDQEAAFQKKQNAPADARPLEELLEQSTESFRDQLLRMIDEKGLTHSAAYNAANVSKQVFNSIKHKEDYIPTKKTILALAIALKLNTRETNELLAKAGYALSDCSRFDLIVKYHIDNKNYNLKEIDQALFDHGMEGQLFEKY